MVQYSLTVRLKDQYGNYVAGEVSVFKDTTAIISYAPASYGTWVKPMDAGTYTVRAYYPQVTRTQTQETIVTLDRDRIITFTFTAPPPPPPAVYYILTIKSTGGGRTSPIAAPYKYAEGSTVSVEAIPNVDYALDHWNLDGVNIGKPNPTTVLMNANHTIEAVFVYSPPAPPPPPPPPPTPTPVEYTLAITTTFGGTTNPAPGQYTYAEGSMASITALPQQDYVFDHWNLDGINVGAYNPVSVTMNTNHSLEAVFTYSPAPPPVPPPVAPPVAPVEYILAITTTFGGTTNPSPGQYTYAEGSMASVTAIPQENYVFDHWNLDAVNIGASNPISISMNKNHTLEAVFTYSPGAPPVTPPVAPPPTVEIIPGITIPTPIIPPTPEVSLPPITPETAGLIVLGVVAVVIVIGAAVWYFTKPPS
jgi:hypothetical protein